MQNINSNDVAQMKNEHIAAITKSYASIDKYLGNLRQIAQNLLKLSEAITDSAAKNSDNQSDAQLWHSLNNIEHQLKLFSTYTEDSIKDFSSTTMQVVKKLQDMRLPK